ncbi:hypothetical protein Pla100_46790 [Neorhodopirellula pilleata]|uniref:Uncharacterized protein n=1 Tax=Neorhodopirellula pilleata TaxID=2714738 RepID=A0A5C6A0S3_9BACT|nr:hypothetical protein Pla100_46790 [Neorhodopirellula pilleata]
MSLVKRDLSKPPPGVRRRASFTQPTFNPTFCVYFALTGNSIPPVNPRSITHTFRKRTGSL